MQSKIKVKNYNVDAYDIGRVKIDTSDNKDRGYNRFSVNPFQCEFIFTFDRRTEKKQIWLDDKKLAWKEAWQQVWRTEKKLIWVPNKVSN